MDKGKLIIFNSNNNIGCFVDVWNIISEKKFIWRSFFKWSFVD